MPGRFFSGCPTMIVYHSTKDTDVTTETSYEHCPFFAATTLKLRYLVYCMLWPLLKYCFPQASRDTQTHSYKKERIQEIVDLYGNVFSSITKFTTQNNVNVDTFLTYEK